MTQPIPIDTRPPLPGARLPGAVVKLGWISFFTDIASEMVYPVVPLFLVGALGVRMPVLGLIEGIAESLVSVMKGWSGWHSDRKRLRVPYVRWGYGLAALSKPLLAAAFIWPVVLAARMLDRFGKGLRTTARDALIADVIEKQHAGRAFGFHRAMDTAGALVGVLAAAALLAWMSGHYRTIFLLATLPGAAAVFLTFRLREPAPPTAPGAPRDSESRTLPNAPPADKLPPQFWWSMLPLVVFALANSSDTFLIVRAKDFNLSDSTVILAYAWYNLTYALGSYPAGIVADKLGYWRVMSWGWLLYAAVYAGFAVTGAVGLWPLFALYGIFRALTEGTGKALINQHAPATKRGTAQGIFQMGTGLATLAASLLTGFLWQLYGAATAFGADAILALVAVLVLVLLRPRLTRRA